MGQRRHLLERHDVHVPERTHLLRVPRFTSRCHRRHLSHPPNNDGGPVINSYADIYNAAVDYVDIYSSTVDSDDLTDRVISIAAASDRLRTALGADAGRSLHRLPGRVDHVDDVNANLRDDFLDALANHLNNDDAHVRSAAHIWLARNRPF